MWENGWLKEGNMVVEECAQLQSSPHMAARWRVSMRRVSAAGRAHLVPGVGVGRELDARVGGVGEAAG